MGETVFESCHSTWIFDTGRMRFRRLLKGGPGAGRVDAGTVTTQWRPYHQLWVDPRSDEFTVALNAEGTRLLHSWRHTHDCAQCGGRATTELSPAALRSAVGL
ncbi:MAG: hypothetical protein ABSG81_04345 [Acidimicrobiales bacterium]|jgi:hypothetical protein